MKTIPSDTQRLPWLAGGLSTLLPGLGHVYCGLLPQGLLYILAVVLINGIGLLVFGLPDLLGVNLAFTMAMLLFLLNVPIILGASYHATYLARQTRKDYRLKEYNRVWVYLTLVLISSGSGFSSSLIIREQWIQPFKVPGASMSPTIFPGDHLMVRKGVYTLTEPERGEVVVFRNPEKRSMYFVKRTVAVAGDRVAIKDGRLLVNGVVPVSERQLAHTKTDAAGSVDDFAEIVVPPYHCFVLGDNITKSKDSRQFGPIPYASLVGRAEFIYWSKSGISQLGKIN